MQTGNSTRSFQPATADGLGAYGRSAKGVVSSIGSPVIPVVMVNFADKSFREDHTAEKITRFFNEEGYHDESNSRASVADYFTAQSCGMFRPEFKVVAEVTLSNGYAYYGKDGSNGSTDTKSYEFVSEALKLASAVADFGDYCTEGTTTVPLVALMFVYRVSNRRLRTAIPTIFGQSSASRPTRLTTANTPPGAASWATNCCKATAQRPTT